MNASTNGTAAPNAKNGVHSRLNETPQGVNRVLAMHVMQLLATQQDLELCCPDRGGSDSASYTLTEILELLGLLPRDTGDWETEEDRLRDCLRALKPDPMHMALVNCYEALLAPTAAEGLRAALEAMKWAERQIAYEHGLYFNGQVDVIGGES